MTGVRTRRLSESRQTSGCQIECSVGSSISEHKSLDMNTCINLAHITKDFNQIKTATFVRGERANCRAQRAHSDQLQANAGRGRVLSSSAKARLHELQVQWRSFRCLFLRLFLFLLSPRLLLSLCLFECPLAFALQFEKLVRWALHALKHVLLALELVLVLTPVLTLGARRAQLLPERGHALVARVQLSHDALCIGSESERFERSTRRSRITRRDGTCR